MKCMKIKFNSEDDLTLKKILELHKILIAVRFISDEGNRHYPKFFLEECLYKL